MELEILKLNDSNKVFAFLRKVDSTFPIPLSQKTDLQVLSDKLCENGAVFIAKVNRKTAGLIGMYSNDTATKTAYISVLAVLSEYYGRGIASLLLKESVEYAKLCGMETLSLYTHKTNAGAIHLYNKAGFTANFDKNRPDDILFTLELNNL